MKKFISMLIALMLLATFACAEDLQVQIIGEATGDGSVAAEEVISIDHIVMSSSLAQLLGRMHVHASVCPPRR